MKISKSQLGRVKRRKLAGTKKMGTTLLFLSQPISTACSSTNSGAADLAPAGKAGVMIALKILVWKNAAIISVI